MVPVGQDPPGCVLCFPFYLFFWLDSLLRWRLVDQTLELRHLWGMHHERGRGFPQVTWEQFGINQLTVVTTGTPNITRKS